MKDLPVVIVGLLVLILLTVASLGTYIVKVW